MKKLKPLIGICGIAGSGKDTLAQGIAMLDVYFVYHFADPIKNALNAMFGWGPVHWENREWKEQSLDWLSNPIAGVVSPRILAQTLGTEWGRDLINEEIWLRIAQQKFEKVNTTAQMTGGRVMGMGMIIPDVRFENEAAWIKEAGGLLFEVQRPGHEPISESSHVTEAGIPDKYVDAIIINDGPKSKMVTDARRILWESSGLSENSQAG